MMKITNKIQYSSNIIIILTIFLTIINCYSIDGPYRLQLDQSFKIINNNRSIIFDFQKDIVNMSNNNNVSVSVNSNSNNLYIKYHLSILACSSLQYSYEIVDKFISFKLQKIGSSRYQCKSGQLQQIMNKIDKIVYTSTITNVLFFYSASGKQLIKLNKIQDNTNNNTNKLSTLSGIWKVSKLLQNEISLTLRANSTNIQFCNGNGDVEYIINKTNKNIINFNIIKSKGCSINDLFSALYRAQFIRYGYKSQDILIYGDDYTVSVIMRNVAELPDNGVIVFPPATTINNTINNNNNSNIVGNSVTQNNNNLSSSASFLVHVPPAVTNSIKNQDKLTTTPINISPTTLTSSSSLSSPPSVLSQTKPNIQTIKQQPLQITTYIPQASQITPTLPPIPIPINIKKQDIYGAWYYKPLSSNTNTNTNIMIVISATSFMLYGECGVWFTTYNIINNNNNNSINITNILPRNTIINCMNANIKNNSNIFNILSNVYSITMKYKDSKQKILSFQDKNNIIIANWTNIKTI